MRAVAQKEVMLRNMLSRDLLDREAFEKISTLSKEIQDAYKGIIMLDVGFAVQQDVDQKLWRSAFYKVIETFRKYGKLFLGYAGKTEVLSQEEIKNCLKQFLEDAQTFYKGLLEFLQKGHEFSVQDVVNQPRKAQHLGKNVSTLASHIFFPSYEILTACKGSTFEIFYKMNELNTILRQQYCIVLATRREKMPVIHIGFSSSCRPGKYTIC